MTSAGSEIKSVLVVDNQRDWHQRLTNLLGSDFSLTCVESYAEAVKALDSQSTPFHVVITEIRLNETRELEEEGFNLTEEINYRGEHTQVIFLSRYTLSENTAYVRKAYRELRAFDYVQKNPQIGKDTGEGIKLLSTVRAAAEEAESRRNVFIAMPFAKEYTPFYKQVKRFLREELGLNCQRADDIFKPGIVLDHIMQGIRGAKIVIADLSGANPNVSFEVGIAHANGKSVLLLTRDSEEMSKRLLGNLRFLPYESTGNSRQLRQDLTRAILDLQGNNYPVVFEKNKFDLDAKACFTLQPAGPDSDDTYKRIIAPAANSAGLSNSHRMQEIIPHRILLHTIWDYINQAGVVVTDLTGKDSDICYLSGQAYGLDKPTVIIAKKTEKIPFNFLAGKPIFFSKELQSECDKARQDIEEAIGSILPRAAPVGVKKDQTIPQHQSRSDIMSRADTLLVTATPVETEAVLNLMGQKFGREPEAVSAETNIYWDLGDIHDSRVMLVQCETGSLGPSGALLTIGTGITELEPKLVIMVGIAFGVDTKKQSIGQVLVSKQILDYEMQRVGTEKETKEVVFRMRGNRTEASADLLSRFRAGAITWKEADVIFGLILSGAKLVDNLNYRDALRAFEPEAIGGEMEGAGLYAAAQRHNKSWILVKGVCDFADGNKSRYKKKRQVLAAGNAASFVFHVLEKY